MSERVQKFLPSGLYVIDSPNSSAGSGSGVALGLVVVMDLTMSLPVTVHSYASAYVRSTILLRSGDIAAPVTMARPGGPSVFSVLLLGRVTSPAAFSGTGVVL